MFKISAFCWIDIPDVVTSSFYRYWDQWTAETARATRLPVSAVPRIQTVITMQCLQQSSPHHIIYKSTLFGGHIASSMMVMCSLCRYLMVVLLAVWDCAPSCYIGALSRKCYYYFCIRLFVVNCYLHLPTIIGFGQSVWKIQAKYALASFSGPGCSLDYVRQKVRQL